MKVIYKQICTSIVDLKNATSRLKFRYSCTCWRPNEEERALPDVCMGADFSPPVDVWNCAGKKEHVYQSLLKTHEL